MELAINPGKIAPVPFRETPRPVEKTTLPKKETPAPTHVEPVKAAPTTEIVNSTPITTHIPVYSADLIPGVAGSLARCGIDVAYVNPVPLGEGANHMVYAYNVKDKPKRVIKIAKPKSAMTMTADKKEEQDNIDLGEEEFREFAVPTELKNDPQNPDFFCIVQDQIEGEAITNVSLKSDPESRRQLLQIAKLNRDLYRRRKKSVDFVGWPGFGSWVSKQKGKFFSPPADFIVSNILKGKDGRLKIIEFEHFTFTDEVPFKQKLKSSIGFWANWILMKHYFGLDIVKGKD